MARVPITVMGFQCERCHHEWIPNEGISSEPLVCPACGNSNWNEPDKKKKKMPYEIFRSRISEVLRQAGRPLTWTEIRTIATLPQAFPNNQWVHRMEQDIGLIRTRESDGSVHWTLPGESTLD